MIQKRHEIVLFLGAGFSAHAGLPVMSRFGEFAGSKLSEMDALAFGKHPSGYREGARLFAEAGRVWEKLERLCPDPPIGTLIDKQNIEDLFSFVEAMRENGQSWVSLENQRHSLDYISTMMRLWIWCVYQQCPIASIEDKQFWNERKNPYVALASQLQQPELRDRVAVLTTNYDLIFESLLLHETKALRADAGHVGASFATKIDNEDVLIPADRSAVPIRKLHGSIDLFTLEATSYPSPSDRRDGHYLPVIPQDWNPRFVQASYLDKAQHIQGRLAVLQVNSMIKLRRRFGESLTPAIAPPSFQKANRYDWLRHTWIDAQRALENAKHIIFIGYSMPPSDGHLRGLFTTSLALRKDRPIVRVLDASKDVIARYREMFGITDSASLHHGKFENSDSIAILERWLPRVGQQEGSRSSRSE